MSKFTQRAVDKLNKNLNPHLTQQGVIADAYHIVDMYYEDETLKTDLTVAEFTAICTAGGDKPVFIRIDTGFYLGFAGGDGTENDPYRITMFDLYANSTGSTITSIEQWDIQITISNSALVISEHTYTKEFE